MNPWRFCRKRAKGCHFSVEHLQDEQVIGITSLLTDSFVREKEGLQERC
jgi:hypothetical protein